ncbi:MAG TPA: hypothetical protein VKY37_00495 [Brumimicrobium sp.]|nr:hypothetical protein [Brumimicrobium sp.]
MKKIGLMALLTLMMMVVSFEGKAQENSSVLITIIKSGREITLQVVSPDYTVSSEKFRFKKEEPDEMILKREMDKWLEKGYHLGDTYVYNHQKITGNTTFNTTYVNYVLIKKEE